jgi:hypothetical protein
MAWRRRFSTSARAGRIAHFGTLRPGSQCFVHFPVALGCLYLPVRVLWCVILGAEWRSDGERHLRSHSGLWFTTLTAPQRTVLTGVLERLSAGDHPLRACEPWAPASSLGEPRMIGDSGGDVSLRLGTHGRKRQEEQVEVVVISGARPLG